MIKGEDIMGTYGISAQEICDKLEQIEFESKLEGDFTEKAFVEGAKKYIKLLRSMGATIHKG